MPLAYSRTTEQITTAYGIADPEPTTRTTVRHTFIGRAAVSLSRSGVEICDPHGSDTRQTLTYYENTGAIADAVADWLSALRLEVTRAAANGDLENNRSAQSCVELLRRFAGEMGLSYAVPTPAEAK